MNSSFTQGFAFQLWSKSETHTFTEALYPVSTSAMVSFQPKLNPSFSNVHFGLYPPQVVMSRCAYCPSHHPAYLTYAADPASATRAVFPFLNIVLNVSPCTTKLSNPHLFVLTTRGPRMDELSLLRMYSRRNYSTGAAIGLTPGTCTMQSYVSAP